MISEPLANDGFVGRREELAFLYETFARARDERARFVPVEGEAGIGKSRLIDEFAAAIAGQAAIASGQCSEQVRSPYLPFSGILARLETRGARRAFEPRRRRGNAEEKAAFFEDAAGILEHAGRRKPVVAIVEDLQWADSATLELLTYLLGNLDRARVLFLVSLRTEGVAKNPALAAFRLYAARRRVTAVRLRGLRRNEIRYLVAQRLGAGDAAAISPEAIAQIESLSEGNPLFAEELVRTVRDSGGLNLATHAPLSLQAMLSERLTPLSEEQRAVLVRAAIVGRRFEAAFLAKIVGLPLERVLDVLQRAVDADLVVGSPAAPLDFAFRHAMIRQALADQLIVGLAAPLHARVAEELEGLPGGENRAAELAYHWSAARVADKARLYNERAAEAAWGLYAYRDAIGFYTMALQWGYPAGAERAALYERLGTLLYIEGYGEEPTVWFEKCRAEYARLDNPIGTSHALLRLADQYWVDARTGDSLEAAARAAAMLERLDRPGMLAEALLSIARFSITAGDALEARRHLTAAGELAAHFDVALQTSFHEVRAETHAALGNARAALDDCRAASRLARRSGVSETIAQIENNYALVAADLGELDLAVERHEIALAEARRTSMLWRVAYSALNYADTLMLRGELERARGLAWEAIESGVTTATFKTKAAAVGIPLALLLNDRQLLEACADDEAPGYAARSRETQRVGAVAAAFAGLRGAQGDAGEARAILARATAEISHPHRCLNLFLQIAIAGDSSERCWGRSMLADWPARPRVKRAGRLLFEALAATDDTRLERIARIAATACSSLGWHLHAARALEAAGHTDEALRRYAGMGDVRDAERLRSRARAGTPDPIELSRRQMEVARLVADGETNRRIAAILSISEHTVEHHLSTIFARLGLRSRSALAAHIGRLPSG
ncbi:MAG TPA: AAA family ATPase [Candidatus Tumulicola sp.]|jgi:DNA-binding CsgD family transcriptional regulator